jgi:hypothetical protein
MLILSGACQAPFVLVLIAGLLPAPFELILPLPSFVTLQFVVSLPPHGLSRWMRGHSQTLHLPFLTR